jgi:hypothetical protein
MAALGRANAVSPPRESPREGPPSALSEEGASRIAEHGLVLVAAAWMATRALILACGHSTDPAAHQSLWYGIAVDDVGDLRRYFGAASAWVDGGTPYRDIALEYPPGALLLFALPRLFATTFDAYVLAFGIEMLAFDALTVLLLVRLPALLAGPDRAGPRAHRVEGVLVALAYVVLSASLGQLLVRRFDVAVGAILVAFVHRALADRRGISADLLLAVGIFTKLTPAVLVPLYLIFRHARAGANNSAPPGSLVRWLARAGWRHVARIVAFAALLLAPFAWLAGRGLGQVLHYHAARDLQIESLPASVLVFAQSMRDIGVTAKNAFGAVEIAHPAAHAVAVASGLAVVLAVGAIAIMCARRLRDADGAPAQARIFVGGAVASLLAAMTLAKVFSPQYLLWLAPLLPLVLLGRGARVWIATAALFLLTTWVYAFDYYGLCLMHRLPAACLLARNIIAGALAVWLCARVNRAPAAPLPTALGGRRERALAVLVALGVAAWVVLANLTPLHDGALWSALRLGREILAGRAFPRSASFLATGVGRSFAAPEWLSGVGLFLLSRLLHARALGLLQPMVVAVTVLLMLAAVPRAARRSGGFVPLLLLSIHVLSSGADVRPQMFALPAVAALGLTLARWRRSGRVRDLAWFVPVQLAWANLDDAALVGPLVVGASAVAVAIAARMSGPANGDERALGPRDATVLATFAAVLLAATACNPYGLGAGLWAPGWSDGDGQSPFHPAHLHHYAVWSFALLLGAVVGGLALRWRERPLLDCAVALCAVALALHAFRFLPHAAILTFPILASSASTLGARWLTPPHRRRWLGLELGVTLALVALTAKEGYARGAYEHRPLGLGVDSALPFNEVKLVDESHIRGALFNDPEVGGIVAFALGPRVRPVIDARFDPKGEAARLEYESARGSSADFLSYLERYEVDLVLLRVVPANLPLLRTLGNDDRWALGHESTKQGLYVRKAALGSAPSRSPSSAP